jgi:thymidylate synthase
MTNQFDITHVNKEDITSAYLELVKKVYNEGEDVKDERGSDTRELLHVVTNISNPTGDNYFHINVPIYENIKSPKGTFWTGERLEKYCKEFTSSDRKGFIYTYGNRYRGWFDTDQIRVAIDRLKNCAESRRAISVTWDPRTDTVNDEVPCMIFVDFKIRDGLLYTAATWRSHDIAGAWYANVVGLTYLAQYVASEIGNVSVGPITVFSISAHIYHNDLKMAEQLLKDNDI